MSNGPYLDILENISKTKGWLNGTTKPQSNLKDKVDRGGRGFKEATYFIEHSLRCRVGRDLEIDMLKEHQ